MHPAQVQPTTGTFPFQSFEMSSHQTPYILLVDDEQLILDTLRIHLRTFVTDGLQILTASSGEEALAIVREELELGYYPALAIVDYMMHPMRGSEVLVELEAIAPRAKKILLTGQADLEAVRDIISQVKLYRYMEKPWQPMDMELTVATALRIFEQESQFVHDHALLVHRGEEAHRREQSILQRHDDMARGLNYARFVQECFMPETERELAALEEVHVMDRPLAGVSGDFRWYLRSGNDLYLALGDCTGHGMAGALITILATDILNNLIRRPGQTSKGCDTIIQMVLGHLHSRLARSNVETDHVSMDLTVLRIGLAGQRLEWASFNGNLVVIGPDGLPVVLSKSRGFTSFSTKGRPVITKGALDIAGHRVLLFSDGITDQFGGMSNKRLQFKGLQEWITRGRLFSAGECHIDALFDEWRGDTDQVDDCIWLSFRMP